MPDQIVKDIVKQLSDDNVLEKWSKLAKEESREDVENQLFEYFLEKNDHRDFDIFDSVTYEIFLHGLSCVCWESVIDELKSK